jgi:Protein kinase domain/Leucine rich repeat
LLLRTLFLLNQLNTLQDLQSGKLGGTRRLKLSCGLTDFPAEILGLADTLEILDLSGNKLSQLPPAFSKLKKLKILFLSENNFHVLPEVLSECTQLDIVGFKTNHISHISENSIPSSLRWLILTNNQIEHLPQSIGKCTRLQKVMLAGNRLKVLPEEMQACTNIELLRISANQIVQFPEWLLTFPRLSWLAFAGNVFNETIPVDNHLSDIAWEELQVKEILGQGASGVIYKSHWNKDTLKEVAVKLFKGEITSDGLPADEMKACIAAGKHPHLASVLGKIKNHPDQKQGLVLELVPSDFKILGGPPDFETCTRDTFADAITFSTDFILQVAKGISDAANQLHQNEIMHGDLYAHNILVNTRAHALLSDFGAATFYGKNKPSARALQQIEVRAFGCLLDDLLTRVSIHEQGGRVAVALSQLRQHCMADQIEHRPDFRTIQNSFKEISKA